jgi:Mg/Co/Ni transporter MgtE
VCDRFPSINSDSGGISSFRMMPICFAMGQATGTAASISVNKGLSPADIDIKLLQRTLLSQGVEAPDVSGC